MAIGGDLPVAPAGAAITPAATQDYRLGPLDTISVNVFREPDLSVERRAVSLSGKVSLPLIGELPVAGKSTGEVADEVEGLLNARYLRNANVSVSLDRAANFTVTVDGEVKKPGVYQIPGAQLTLLQAVALGEGATDLAKLDEVLIIRTIENKRYVARFDLRDIRAARTPDPLIQQSDVVVVGFSRAASLFRVGTAALPGLAGLFIALNQN